jgi:hypothetical protein
VFTQALLRDSDLNPDPATAVAFACDTNAFSVRKAMLAKNPQS